MRQFLCKHPYLFGSIVFAGTTFVVLAEAYLLGISILSSAECPSYLGDPCDAAPMFVMSLWMISIPIALAAASAATAFAIFFSRIYRNEE